VTDDAMRSREPAEQNTAVPTRHGLLTLEQIADALPGTAETMVHVARAWARCAYAARGGNWPLAAYYARRVRSLQRTLAVTRPKHRDRLESFEREQLGPLFRAIEARDRNVFERAFAAATERANEMHVETGHGYIRWVLPDEPPTDLVLGPLPDE
jgi:hypothetical protein